MDPTDKLPRRLFQVDILSKFKVRDLIVCAQVSKKWNSWIPTDLKKEMVLASKVTIGPAQWSCLGDIGEVPPLPDDIKEEMQKDCPYFKGQKKYNTCRLVLMPKSINGKDLTISHFESLILELNNEDHASFSYCWQNQQTTNAMINKVHAISASYWMIVTEKLLLNSQDKCFIRQKKLLKEKYEVPLTIEVIVSIAMNYIASGIRKEIMFGEMTQTKTQMKTRCKENFSGNQIVVGFFHPFRLYIGFEGNHKALGIAGVQKLPF